MTSLQQLRAFGPRGGEPEGNSRSWLAPRIGGAPSAGWPDREIAAIAATQRTLITHAQLLSLGVSRDAIDRALSRGRLHRIHRGVYSLIAPPALPPLALEHAALLACGTGAFISHHTAASTWGIRPPAGAPIEVTLVGRDAGRRRTGIRVHKAQRLDRRDARSHEGLRILSPARTLLDIAPDLGDRELERAFDEALGNRLMTRAAVRALLAAYPRRAGCARLKELAQDGRTTTMTRSGGEERMLALLRKGALPMPEVNVPWGRWEIDFLWRKQGVAVEIDAYEFHSSRAALERNHRKDADLQAAGMLVLRFSGRELSRRPESVLVRVASTLAQR